MDSVRSEILIFDQELVAEREYWLNRLSETAGGTNFAADYPKPSRATHALDEAPVNLNGETYQKLCQLTRGGPFLIYTTLMAALKICISRYTGGETIVVGSPSLKDDKRLNQATNVLAIVDQIDDRMTFRQFLFNVRQTLLDAYSRQRYPFHQIVKDLGLDNGNARCPLFDVALALTDIHTELPRVNNDLTIRLSKESDRIAGRVEYSPELYERGTIERFAGHFANALKAALGNIDAMIRDVPVLSEAERYRMAIEWNETDAAYRRDWCVHQLFEFHAERTQDALALIFEDQHVTYEVLNRRANQVAHHLQGLGVGPETKVALCAERSLDVVVGLLGILKAGGAYIPLDPQYPKERLALMLKEAQPSALLMQEHLAGKLPEPETQVVYLDRGWADIALESGDNPISNSTPGNLAYVIYTSGSTNRPKGVLVEHHGLCNVAEAQRRAFETGPGSLVLQFASLSFDASIFEIVMALGSGASLCVASRDSLLPGPALIKLLRERSITIVTLPPSSLTVMPSDRLPALKTITVAGEACPAELVTRWSFERKFFNLYGPTEATIWATSAECIVGSRAPSIGRPIANTKTYAVDSHLQQVPIGVAGELHIGGVGLARGYHSQPDVTATRFIPDPFSKKPGARLYKSGDLVRYREDGNLEFLGRLDHQVKVRGYRIELAEIEALLSQHPSVREAVVVAREYGPGEKRLVAYLGTGAEHNVTVDQARSFLAERLPEYMVPPAFVFLEKLPLTPNGKIDRHRLPEPSGADLNDAYRAPRTQTEEMLSVIWAQVLGVERVGIDDSFSDLGGHSLHATQIMSRVLESLKVELPLQRLFEAQTIAKLSESIEAAMRITERGLLPPIRPVPRHQFLAPSFAQKRLWFLAQVAPDSSAYNIFSTRRVTGELSLIRLEQSLSEVVRRHEALRTRFVSREGEPVQMIDPAESMKLRMVDLRGLGQIERQRQFRMLARQQAMRPFNLAEGPLLRSLVISLDEVEHGVLLTMHHIISDGWSLEVLRRELAVLQNAYSRGVQSPLPELNVQYADFAVWQREWLQGEVLEQQLAYWRKKLAGAPPVLELPADRPRPLVKTFRGEHHSVVLPEQLSAALKIISRQEGSTLFMTLLGAFQILLARYTGREDMVVGTTIAGRTRIESEGLIGCFNNTLVLRTDLSGAPSFREVLKRVREVMMEAYAHQDLPFEKLVEELAPDRSLSHTPLFQVALVLQNMLTGSVLRDLTELENSGLGSDGRTAKVDLTLDVTEVGDRIVGTMKYDTDLFDENRMKRMLRHWQTLLEALVADPDRPLWNLPLLTELEMEQLLVEWNDTGAECLPGQTIAEIFELRVEQSCDAVAVSIEEENVTYGELNQRANQLGHRLQAMGVGPELLVGLCLERSLDMIVGVLGILKAGGAYLPIDPEHPLERLAFTLENSSIAVLLTHERLLASLPAHWAQVVCLDSEWDSIGREIRTNPIRQLMPGNPAYVIYTSGSTGKPKGVLLEHAGLCNLVSEQIRLFGVDSGSRVLQFASLGFDASVSETFMALISGACLQMAHRETLLSAPALIRLMREESISHVTLPPSFLSLLDSEGLPALRAVISAGESCNREVTQRWAAERRFFNAYGPTEATIGPTCYLVEQGQGAMPNIPIGRPICNTQAYVVDPHLQAAPVAITGELCLGGIGLARGYLNLPDLTGEKFIPNPFSNEPGARLYRTGDLGRYRIDGNIEFAGRVDHQLKLRGFRIEPGEVEAALEQHPSIKQAVVAGEQGAAGSSLVAYVVTGNRRQIELWPSVAEYFVYDDLLYYAMTHDQRRNDSYKAAINRTVRDKVVVDIGTGKDAILARFCAEAGAKKVYAIELLEESYQQAKARITELDLEDKIRLIHGDATKVELPEKADVCVSEIVGPIGGVEGAAYILSNARRFLKEGGVMIPQRSITRIAAVTLPDEFIHEPGFTESTRHYVKKIFDQVGYRFDLRLCLKGMCKADLMSDTEVFEDLDFRVENSREYSREASFTITRRGRIDGLLVWLNLYTIEDELIDILEHEHCWLPVYLPVFDPGIEVEEGDRIEGTISGAPCENSLNPDYKIRGRIVRGTGEAIEFDYDSYHNHPSYRRTRFYQRLFGEGEEIKVESNERPKVTSLEVRSYLQERLPSYMLPSRIEFLEALPLTPNGKIDRRMLASLEKVQPSLKRDYAAPRTGMERTIAAIWQEELKVKKVGIHDNFFDLGGHSLLMVQVNSKLQAAVGRELSIVDLFKYPTVSSLAEHLLQYETAEDSLPQEHPEDELEKLEGVKKRQRQLRLIQQAERAHERFQNE